MGVHIIGVPVPPERLAKLLQVVWPWVCNHLLGVVHEALHRAVDAIERLLEIQNLLGCQHALVAAGKIKPLDDSTKHAVRIDLKAVDMSAIVSCFEHR